MPTAEEVPERRRKSTELPSGLEHGREYFDTAPGSPTGAHPVLPLKGKLGPGPWQQPGGYTRRVTGIVLRALESVLRSSISVGGHHRLGKGPILFVSNHFTRFETFILPYVIDRYTHRNVHSLAHWSLFRGKFGDYLRSIGAMSTRDPTVKTAIVEELLRGLNDWVIYPEGSMIKDKLTWQKGQYAIASPDRVGPVHTGAAVLALQVEIYRHLYLEACRRGDVAKRAEYEARFHIKGPESLPSELLSVVPINITYYPIRPTKNLFYKVARFMLKELPSRMEDELMIEGSLLLDRTDISMYFGSPITFDRYRELLKPALDSLGDTDDETKVRTIIDNFKTRLTTRFMGEIYSRLTVNFDHLFCSGLRNLTRDRVDKEEFHLALFLAARELQAAGSRRRHHSLAGRMQAIIADEPYEPLESITKLAVEERMLRISHDRYLVDRQALESRHDFHDIRLKNTVGVIANELEPLREVVKNVRILVNLPREQLRARTAELLIAEDRAVYLREYEACADTPSRKGAATGSPFLLKGHLRLGIVLSHGYLASPGEIAGLARHLNGLGFTVYAPRLAGHGTSPEQLDKVTWTDWLESFDRGYCIMRCMCERVVVAGFSAGGLLALLAAARKGIACAGVVAISPALKLANAKAALAPAIDRWNHLLSLLRISAGHLDYVENRAEWPITNYDRNYVHGLTELERLIDASKRELPMVRVPTLIVQADRDPVVDPASGKQALDLIASDHRELAMMQFARHCIVQGDGAQLVYDRVTEFVRTLEGGLGQLRTARPAAQRSGKSGRFRTIQ